MGQEQQDINIEYERIFGVVHYPTLFNMEDLEYSELRKEIIDAPRVFRLQENLPFENILDFSSEQDIKESRTCSKQNCCNIGIYDIVVGIRNHAIKTIEGILSVLSGGNQPYEPPLVGNLSNYHKHIFWITKAGRCKVYGYIDKETKNFYIGAGSLISAIEDFDYFTTSSYRNRRRLIDKYGVHIENYVKIKKDVKCRTAVAAARYALGAMVNLDLWKDSQGKTLYEVYPEYFFH